MAQLTAISEHIAPDVPQASPILVLQRTRDVVIEFCERTNVWRLDLLDISVENHKTASGLAADGTYDLSTAIPAAWAGKVRVVTVMTARYLRDSIDKPLVGTSEVQLDDEYPQRAPYYRRNMNPHGTKVEWRTLDHSYPSMYLQPDPMLIRLFPKPDTAGTLKVNVALKPLRTASEVGDIVYDDHYRAIADGTLADLFRQQGQPWHQPQSAVTRQVAYEAGVAEALGKQVRSNLRDDRPVSNSLAIP